MNKIPSFAEMEEAFNQIPKMNIYQMTEKMLERAAEPSRRYCDICEKFVDEPHPHSEEQCLEEFHRQCGEEDAQSHAYYTSKEEI